MGRSSLQVSLLVSLVCLWCTGVAIARQEIDEAKAAKVKAAYLYNFVKFVKWPDDAFAEADAPVVIGVVGEDPFGPVLDRTVRDKRVGNRSITIRRIKAPAPPNDPPEPDAPALDPAVARELDRCHVIYIDQRGKEWCPQVLEHLRRKPVLTVSDVPTFARQGGMIEFVLEEGRIVFHINRKVAEECRLRLSAKLLKLATIVESHRP
ncbi:MAG: YfiR family protein [Planctomycetota bacterium]|jgi:hypothetical protein